MSRVLRGGHSTFGTDTLKITIYGWSTTPTGE